MLRARTNRSVWLSLESQSEIALVQALPRLTLLHTLLLDFFGQPRDTPAKSRRGSRISRRKVWFPWVSRISGPQSLGLYSFVLPEKNSDPPLPPPNLLNRFSACFLGRSGFTLNLGLLGLLSSFFLAVSVISRANPPRRQPLRGPLCDLVFIPSVPLRGFAFFSEAECTKPSHSQSLANFVANFHSQGISAMRTNFSPFHSQNHSHSLANSSATLNSQLFA